MHVTDAYRMNEYVQVGCSRSLREVCVHHSNTSSLYKIKIVFCESRTSPSGSGFIRSDSYIPSLHYSQYREMPNLILAAAKRLLDVWPSFLKAVSNQTFSPRLRGLTGGGPMCLKPPRSWNFTLKGSNIYRQT